MVTTSNFQNNGGLTVRLLPFICDARVRIRGSTQDRCLKADVRVVNRGTRAAEHQGCNWGMRTIYGGNYELCSIFQWRHLALHERNEINSFASLFSDGSN